MPPNQNKESAVGMNCGFFERRLCPVQDFVDDSSAVYCVLCVFPEGKIAQEAPAGEVLRETAAMDVFRALFPEQGWDVRLQGFLHEAFPLMGGEDGKRQRADQQPGCFHIISP